jgi:hypothetical protein
MDGNLFASCAAIVVYAAADENDLFNELNNNKQVEKGKRVKGP